MVVACWEVGTMAPWMPHCRIAAGSVGRAAFPAEPNRAQVAEGLSTVPSCPLRGSLSPTVLVVKLTRAPCPGASLGISPCLNSPWFGGKQPPSAVPPTPWLPRLPCGMGPTPRGDQIWTHSSSRGFWPSWALQGMQVDMGEGQSNRGAAGSPRV